MDSKFLVLMTRTTSAHRELSDAWLADTRERLHNLRTWHQDMKNRLHQARCDTAELPSKLIELESEIATLERLDIVPLAEMVREVKP